ncbi:MAG: flagellar filament capping protein FliD [Planctomycetes bacterium]|nr:flagellar filament capping protein FliD [Planctomycetota bacterium]
MPELGSLRFDGVLSGINFTQIIEQLTKFKRARVEKIDLKIQKQSSIKTALLEVNAKLLAFQAKMINLSKPSSFNATTVASSNESVLKASGSQAGALGSFQFTVEEVATSQVIVSNGFADPTSIFTTASATLSIEVGGGYISRRTPSSFLNGQNSFDKGKIKITDRAGKISVIDMTGAVTLKDVLDKINGDTTISVSAYVQSDRLVVEDKSGGTGSLKIENIGTTFTATELGVSGTSSTGFIYGTNVNYITSNTSLTSLNDFLGVGRNTDSVVDFFITDTDGTRFSVDINASATTVGAALSRINSAASTAGSSLRAKLNEDRTRVVLYDSTGASTITVSSTGSSTAAVDLGFGYASAASFFQYSTETTAGVQNRLIGNRITPTLNSTLRNLANGGQNFKSTDTVKGIRDGNIFVRDKDGDSTTIDINKRFSTAGTVSSGTAISVTSTDGLAKGNKIRIVDTSGNQYYRTITGISGTMVSFDQSVSLGGGSSVTVNGHIESMDDLLNLLNTKAAAASVNVTFSLNSMENGFMAKDGSSNPTTTILVSGSSGSYMGFTAGSNSTSGTSLIGSDIDIQYISADTKLSRLNQGNGVGAGKIKITDTDNIQFEVDLSQSTDNTIGRVLTDINGAAVASNSSVRARVNDNGDGIILEDDVGTTALTVAESGSTTTAKDLKLLGTANSSTPNKIDGTFEKAVSIAANATVNQIVSAINSAGMPIIASVLQTSDPLNPYRVSIVGKVTGFDGTIVIGGTLSGFNFQTTTQTEDSILIAGTTTTGAEPLVVTSSKNTIPNVLPGLTLDLVSRSSTPVTVTISKDTAGITQQAKSAVEEYNNLQKKITELTKFDTTTFAKGVLFGDSTVRTIKTILQTSITTPVSGIASSDLNTAQEIGIKVANDGLLTFNESTFTNALLNDPNEVLSFFTLQRKMTATTSLKDFRSGAGVDSVVGSDFKVFLRDAGLTITVDLTSGASTIGSGTSESVGTLINKVNLATLNTGASNNGKMTLGIDSSGFALSFTDNSVTTKTVDTGGSGSFTDSEMANRDSTGVVGATVTFITGANAGQSTSVTAYTSGTGVVTLANPFVVAASDTYKIERKIQVSALNSSPAAAQMGILGTATNLTDLVFKGTSVNLKSDPGFAFYVNTTINGILDTPDGILTQKTTSIDDKIKGLEEDKDELEELIKKEEERLVREFAKLEQVIAQSQSTLARLSTFASSVQSGLSAGLNLK